MSEEKRGYFFVASDAMDRFLDGHIPTEETYRKLINSVVFFAEDIDQLVPTGGSIGEILYIKNKDTLGKNITDWKDISNFITDENPFLVPEYRNKPTGYILWIDEDVNGDKIMKWKPFDYPDLEPYITEDEAFSAFVQKTQLYKVAGNSNNKVPVLGTNNKIPAEFLDLSTNKTFYGNWDASTNTPTLSILRSFEGCPPQQLQRTTIDGVVVPAGTYLDVAISGVTTTGDTIELANTWEVGDTIVSNGTQWLVGVNESCCDLVTSVNNETGDILIDRLIDGGAVSAVTKQEILDHFDDEDIHITTSGETYFGVKSFHDGIETDLIHSYTGGTILFADHIAFTGNTMARVNGIDQEITGTTQDYSGNTTFPTTYAVLDYFETKTGWTNPSYFTSNTTIPKPTVTVDNQSVINAFVPGGTMLDNLKFDLIDVGGVVYASFPAAYGYIDEELDFLENYFNAITITNPTNLIREFKIDYTKTNINNVPDYLLNQRFFVGSNIVRNSSGVSFEVYTYNPSDLTFRDITFYGGVNGIFAESRFDNFALKTFDDIYSIEDLMVKSDLEVQDTLSATKAIINQGYVEELFYGLPTNIVSTNSLVITNAPVLKLSELNILKPGMSNVYYKLPQILDDTKLGSKISIVNDSMVNSGIISVNEPLRDEIKQPGNNSTLTTVPINPMERLDFYLIEKNAEWVWQVNQNTVVQAVSTGTTTITGTTLTGETNAITTIASNTVLDDTFGVLLVNAGAGSVTVQLPFASAYALKRYTVKKIDGSGNAVIIQGQAGDTIDGDPNYNITVQNDTIKIISNGTNWYIIS